MPPPLAIWRHAARNKFCAVTEDVARVFFLSSWASAPARVCSSASNKRRHHPGQASDSEREPGSSNPDRSDMDRPGLLDPRLRGDDRSAFGDDQSVCSGMTAVCARQPQTNAAIIPAKRATASASRHPVTPTGAIRTDRDSWIPAGACPRAGGGGDDRSVWRDDRSGTRHDSGRLNQSFRRKISARAR
jgi:hypothetical protein